MSEIVCISEDDMQVVLDVELLDKGAHRVYGEIGMSLGDEDNV